MPAQAMPTEPPAKPVIRVTGAKYGWRTNLGRDSLWALRWIEKRMRILGFAFGECTASCLWGSNSDPAKHGEVALSY